MNCKFAYLVLGLWDLSLYKGKTDIIIKQLNNCFFCFPKGITPALSSA
jgi:hypothetical protein